MGVDTVELFMEIETTFGVHLADSNARNITTIGALFDVIVELTGSEIAQSEADRYSGELWERYLALIEQRTEIRRGRLVPSARFVQDLGLD